MRRLVVCMAVMAGSAVGVQEPGKPVAFEVASVKVAASHDEVRGRKSTGMPPPTTSAYPGRIDYSNVTLKGVLCRAYDGPPDKIVGPAWLESERYDIVATVPKDARTAQIPLMLQSLLAERFRMRVYWVTKQSPGYALVVAKSGPKLTESPQKDASKGSFGFNGNGHLTWKAGTLAEVARVLSTFLDRPVVDLTEITGRFDITLDAAPDSLPGLPSGGSSDESAALPSIFAAIRGLGLNLEARQVSVKQLVVDSAQKVPTPN